MFNLSCFHYLFFLAFTVLWSFKILSNILDLEARGVLQGWRNCGWTHNNLLSSSASVDQTKELILALRGMQHEASEAISWKLAVCTLIILVWFVHLFHAHWIRHTFSIFQLLARLLILHSCLLEVGVCSDKRCRISPRLLHHQLGADLDKYPRSTVVVARHKQTWKAQNLLTYSTDTYTSCHVSSSILKKGTRGLSIQAGCKLADHWSGRLIQTITGWISDINKALVCLQHHQGGPRFHSCHTRPWLVDRRGSPNT